MLHGWINNVKFTHTVHKETALQISLRYNFALLSEFGSENSFSADAFCKMIFQQEEHFPTG